MGKESKTINQLAGFFFWASLASLFVLAFVGGSFLVSLVF